MISSNESGDEHQILCNALLGYIYRSSIKEKHEDPYNIMELLNNRTLQRHCEFCEHKISSDGMKIEISIVNNISGNTITNNITNNYERDDVEYKDDNEDDNEEEMDGIEINEKTVILWDDLKLNKLMMKSLNGTQYDIAKVIYYLNNMKYNYDNDWYVFENHIWQKSDKIREYISDDLIYYYEKIIEYFEKEDGWNSKIKIKKIKNLINSLKRRSFKNDILVELVEIYNINCSQFTEKLDTNPYLIGFTNGVYDLDSMIFRKGRPDDYISQTTGYDYVDSYSDQKDNVINFLEDILPNKNDRDYLMMFISMALTGFNPYETFTIFTGNGRNGKSKLMELIRITFGDYYGSAGSKLLTKRNQVAYCLNIIKKHIVMIPEIEKKNKLNTGFIKFITGHDEIELRSYNNKDKIVKFRPGFITILVCNNIPEIDEIDNSFAKCLTVINFETEFVETPTKKNEKKIDNDLSLKISKWKNDFMLILIEYYKMYRLIGLKPTDNILHWTNKYVNVFLKIEK